MTPEEANSKAQELKDLQALIANPAFKSLLVSRFERALSEATRGGLNKQLSPDKRAEHIEAYHLALDLIELVPRQIVALKKQLLDWEQKNQRSTFVVSDALA